MESAFQLSDCRLLLTINRQIRLVDRSIVRAETVSPSVANDPVYLEPKSRSLQGKLIRESSQSERLWDTFHWPLSLHYQTNWLAT